MFLLKSLSIELIEPVVYLGGVKDKQTITILRGVIHLQLKRSIHMKSATIQFIGSSKTCWPEASKQWDKQVLVDSIIPVCHTPMQLKKGKHTFPFEILLSNTLSESIECGLGHVRYKLICQIHRQSHFKTTKWRVKQSVILVRLPSQDSPRCITQTHHVTPYDQLDIAVEIAHLTPGSSLPISVYFSNPDSVLSLDEITVKLIERQKFRAPSKQSTRILHHEITLFQQHQQQQGNDDWRETRFVFLVPDSLQVHPTTANRIIRVRHWVQVALTLTLANGETKELWMDTPISVLLSPLDDYHTLPVYPSGTIQPTAPSPSSTVINTLIKEKHAKKKNSSPSLQQQLSPTTWIGQLYARKTKQPGLTCSFLSPLSSPSLPTEPPSYQDHWHPLHS
ncbi:hypothetical protein BC941DRAFT_511184 [Chlamydoabsidia padenii]|nr:hypothetical protein BC941DRAFT_511184 [Chlamydoabsidia padenii]